MRRGLGRCDQILLSLNRSGADCKAASLTERASVRRSIRTSPGVDHTASLLAKVAWSQELEPDAKTKATLFKIPDKEFGEMALRPARELVQLQA